jgi:hypothetical protein
MFALDRVRNCTYAHFPRTNGAITSSSIKGRFWRSQARRSSTPRRNLKADLHTGVVCALDEAEVLQVSQVRVGPPDRMDSDFAGKRRNTERNVRFQNFQCAFLGQIVRSVLRVQSSPSVSAKEKQLR